MVEMHLVAVRVELPTNTPVVLLQEMNASERTLPIFVGTPEATAIAYALQGVSPPRPMTHDLIRDMFFVMDVELVNVVITELRGSTYFAEVNLRKGDKEYSISCRPSDAIALAVRMGAPILADDELVEREGVVLAMDDNDSDEEPEEAEDLVDRFREFINDVKPEDFTPPQPPGL